MSFFDPYSHNFVRIAVCVPEVQVADVDFNVRETVRLMQQVAGERGWVAVFPELGLTGYSCDDLFHQAGLLESAIHGLATVAKESAALNLVSVVGLPLRVGQSLFNVAAILCGGRIFGLVPKSYIPNYREYYELRYFSPACSALTDFVDIEGYGRVPFGTDLLFRPSGQPKLTLYAEICEDLWTTIPPSSYGALSGANLIVNPSASNVTVGKCEYRRQLVSNQSARCIAAYAYAASGFGESTTDLAWDGHGIIAENGAILQETDRFQYRSQFVLADVDLDRLEADRIRIGTFGQSVAAHKGVVAKHRVIAIDMASPAWRHGDELRRAVPAFPYVPSDPSLRDERCKEVFEIQVQGLVKRLRAMSSTKVVIGVSGGLDSTHALLVCAKALDVLGLPRANILAYTMPGFATSDRTKQQAHRLMASLGCAAHELDIRPSCMQMLKDIEHPYVKGDAVFDVTFENVQAGERTSHLFRLANVYGAPVVGTSDLSELALGWCTYGVGDHMAHYHVNASVPKTLIQYLIDYIIQANIFGAETGRVLRDVLSTEISPELVPAANGEEISQRTEDLVGPYAIHDFALYHVLRFGYGPEKIAFLAYSAMRQSTSAVVEGVRTKSTYSLGEIKHWLGVFLKRFFQQSQYKRTAAPNAPKVGSGGSLSPRGDWRVPSDGAYVHWRAALDQIPDS